MKMVILDTNFLLIPAQFSVDIFDEVERVCSFKHETVVLDKSINELNSIIKMQKGRDRQAAKLALELIRRKKVKVMKTEGKKGVDDLLAELSAKGCIVATQDKLLKQRLKKPVIVLRQKRHLQLVS